jgi:hypothetical protein
MSDLWISRLISESTWGYPIVGALHVLAIALFGGVVLVPVEARWLKRVGLALVVVSGVLLFMSGASHYYESTSFRIKMVLLVALTVQHRVKPHRAVSLVLWAAVIFASRGIAFF